MSSSIIPKVNKTYLQNLFTKIFSNPDSNIYRPDHRTPSQYREITISHLTQSFNSPFNKLNLSSFLNINRYNPSEPSVYKTETKLNLSPQ